jgi:ribosome biogenesis protein MAK21
MLQILNLHQPSFVCGIIYLAIELTLAFPDLKTLLSVPEEHDFEEMPLPSTSDASVDNIVDGTQPAKKVGSTYDGRKRDPEYSNAHFSCLWEILPFLKHYHPSVDVYATNLLNSQKPNKKPELANHTLIAFLDKFVYKNAKATDQVKGASIMQPVAASGQGQVLLSSSSSKGADSVNSAPFWNKKSEDVAVEDAFFHEYFTQIGKPGQAEREQKRKAKKDAAGEEEDDEEANEAEIWEALVNSRPEVQEDSDDGAGFEDMMSLDDEEKEFRKAMEEDDDDDDALNLDDSDLEFSDEEIEEEEEGEEAVAEDKKDEKPVSERTKKKRALKALPLFASADDYAEMLAQDADGM